MCGVKDRRMLDGELKDEFVAVSRLADARCFIIATFLLFVPPASVMCRSPTGNTRFTNSAINHSGQKPGDRGHKPDDYLLSLLTNPLLSTLILQLSSFVNDRHSLVIVEDSFTH